MQYRSRCNILTHSEMLYFLGIFIKEDIAFLFYKEIYMKYLILYYNLVYFSSANIVNIKLSMNDAFLTVLITKCCSFFAMCE